MPTMRLLVPLYSNGVLSVMVVQPEALKVTLPLKTLSLDERASHPVLLVKAVLVVCFRYRSTFLVVDLEFDTLKLTAVMVPA